MKPGPDYLIIFRLLAAIELAGTVGRYDGVGERRRRPIGHHARRAPV